MIFNTMANGHSTNTKVVECSSCRFRCKVCFTNGECPLVDKLIDLVENEFGKILVPLDEVNGQNRRTRIGCREEYLTENNVPCSSEKAYNKIVNIYTSKRELPPGFISATINEFLRGKPGKE